MMSDSVSDAAMLRVHFDRSRANPGIALTRFSGRTAPAPAGVAPNVAAWVMAEAYLHEVCNCGFWPGNGGYGRAAFNVYAYPEPAGFGGTPLRTPEAFYDTDL